MPSNRRRSETMPTRFMAASLPGALPDGLLWCGEDGRIQGDACLKTLQRDSGVAALIVPHCPLAKLKAGVGEHQGDIGIVAVGTAAGAHHDVALLLDDTDHRFIVLQIDALVEEQS